MEDLERVVDQSLVIVRSLAEERTVETIDKVIDRDPEIKNRLPRDKYPLRPQFGTLDSLAQLDYLIALLHSEHERARRMLPTAADRKKLAREHEATFCFCQQLARSDMVACDNPGCPYEWFHMECVDLVRPPKGTWYCPVCRDSMGISTTKKR